MIATMLEAALRSVILALAVWAGLRIFRVRNVVAQKAAWGLVLAAALLMPILAPQLARLLPTGASLRLPMHTVPPAAQLQAVNLDSVPPVAAVRMSPTSATSAHIVPKHASAPSPYFAKVDQAAEIAPSLNVTSAVIAKDDAGIPVSSSSATPVQPAIAASLVWFVAALYFGVAAALLLRLFYGLARALHLLFTSKPISSDVSAHLAGGVPLRVSRTISSPVTIGSAVVLPADYTDWKANKLRVVVAHERSHIRQCDFYLQFLAGLYAALVWFSPLGWWLKRELSELAETISDRAGLEQAASTTAYAQILLEFAAAPRPAILGVAMASTGSLSRRIERLLNDNAFRQAFAGGRRRALIAVLLVPIALFVTTALVRVQAAQDTQNAQPTPAAQPAIAAQPAPRAKPSPAHPADSGFAAADSSDEDVPKIIVIPRIPSVVVPPIPPISVVVPRIPPIPAITIPKIVIPPMPPANQLALNARLLAQLQNLATASGLTSASAVTNARLLALLQDTESRTARGGFRYRNMTDGDSYAIIRGDHADTMTFSGDMHTVDIDKARKLAHGDFLWFERDDKQYFIDDPATLAQIEAMYKPIEELGKKQEELGRQQEELGKQQEALGQQQEQVSLPAPDVQKEMAEIDAAMAKIKAKMGQNVTQDELGDLQSKLGDLQGQLGDLQGRIGEKQGELGAQQGRLGEQQGRLGAEQGRLGAEQGRLSMEADRKVHSIIDESLQNGKAHAIN